MLNRLLPDKRFARDVFTLISGTTLAQLFPFLMLPVLQRFFFEPQHFGLLAVFSSFAEMFTLAAAMRYELAIVIQKKRADALNALLLSLSLIFGTAFLSLLIIFLFHGSLVSFLEEPAIGPYLYLIPFSVIFYGGYKTMTYWYNWKSQYRTISISKITQSSSGETVKLLAGLAKWQQSGLIIGRVAGQFFAFLSLIILFLRKDLKNLRLASSRRMKQVFIRNKEFALYSTPSSFLSAAIFFVYINMFLKFYGADFVGVVGVSMTYMGVALGIISTSFSQVFYKKVAAIENRQTLRNTYLRFMVQLFFLALVLLAVIYLIPEQWVVVLLGDDWFDLMDVLRIMICWLVISFVSSSLSFIYIKVRRQKVMVIFDVLHLTMVVGSIYFGHRLYQDPFITLWIFAGAQVLYYLVAIFAALTFINRYKPA